MEPLRKASADIATTQEQPISYTAVPSYSRRATTNLESGQEVVFTWPNGKKENAIHHEHIRTQLLQQAEAACSWVHQQPHGHAPDDRTAPVSFPTDQPTWGFNDRADYPPIKFVLHRQGYTHPAYEVLYWYYHGRLVLDLDDKPLKNFLHLPPTVSSKIPGGHIEALLRFDDRTTYADIRGRMPSKLLSVHSGKTTERPLKKLGALSAAAARYREVAGCLNWHDRMGSQVLNDYILANLPGGLKARNTTKGWRNLTAAEITAIRAPAIGSRPQQARKRASSEEAREKREVRMKKRREQAEAVGVDGLQQSKESLLIETIDPPSAAPHFRNEDEDIRKKAPCGEQEIEALRKALRPTLHQVIGIVGFEPVKCDRLSYDDQVRHLKYLVARTYQNLNRADEDPPSLVQLTRWGGGIRNWRSAKLWDGNVVYEINDEGGVGAKILDIDDPQTTSNAPETSHDGGHSELEYGDSPARVDGALRTILSSAMNVTEAQTTNEPWSEHTSANNTDDEPSAGSCLIDARGFSALDDEYVAH
ncbi:MAG: hypothetical protein Q9216_006073 [Gyalolechia sp. 2 TL-2023]